MIVNVTADFTATCDDLAEYNAALQKIDDSELYDFVSKDEPSLTIEFQVVLEFGQ
jgi:hypothetical protein